MAGEFEFIHWLKQRRPVRGVTIGIGDDLATMQWNNDDLLLVGVDQILDGVHFDSTIHSPRDIGTKAMNRNLSDCAAMACLPAAAVCTLALPTGCGEEYAKELYLGIESAGAKFDCPVVGGDTGSWPGKLVITVTILGRSAGITPITRGGAKPGDRIYVSGPLGGSMLGRHMTFEPQIQWARTLAKGDIVTAMADLSDGLGRDLQNICEASGVGAVLWADRIPIHDDVRRLPPSSISPTDHALHDGEDYELLVACSGFIDIPGDFFEIGRIVEGAGVAIEIDGTVRAVKPDGWEHRL